MSRYILEIADILLKEIKNYLRISGVLGVRMKIHYVQHVDFEDPAFILSWAKDLGHTVTRSMLHAGDSLQNCPEFDLLVVMGGPMNVYEYEEYPWLKQEKTFIRNSILSGKYVLGICLGAQLIADALGAPVTRNRCKEIGWFPVLQSPAVANVKPFDALPKEYTALHWHGDTFAIPEGAVLQGSSLACVNQGFIYKERVIGLQYHIEATVQSVQGLIEKCESELVEDGFIHDKERIVLDTNVYAQNAQKLLTKLLQRWLA